ncbi:hypothetical protein D3C73_587580 [compost metagenome]
MLASLLQQFVRQKGQSRRGTDIRLGRHFDDFACNGTGKRIELAMIGLEEAPLGFHIISEGAALVVADAGGLALVQADILHGPEVEAGIVAIYRRFDPPFRRDKRRGQKE